MSVYFEIPRLTPSYSSARLWLLRIGYYKLTRAKEIADDWIWIVDHTIQKGDMKCLLLLGIRQSALARKGGSMTLSYADVEPISLCPVTQSNGPVVLKQLEDAVQKTGIPRQIVGDKGSDLKAGINKFIERYPQTAFIFDVKHFAALLLEKEFKDDLMWNEFCKWASRIRQILHQTPLSYLGPPNQRTKSRFMNMDILVDWGVKILALFDRVTKKPQEKPDSNAIIEKFDWILSFREKLIEWNHVMELVSKTETFVRTHGIYGGCDKELRSLLQLDVHHRTELLTRIRWALIEYVLDESLKAKPAEHLLASSEVIESVFGKFKLMQHDQSKSALTGFVLSIAAVLSVTTEQVVQNALESSTVKVLRKWVSDQFGKTERSKRQNAFSTPNDTEQKQHQLLLHA